MITAELKTYLTRGLKEGYSQEDLTRTLLTLGWDEQDIADAFFTLGTIPIEKTGTALPFPPVPYFIPKTAADGETHFVKPPPGERLPQHPSVPTGAWILLLAVIAIGAIAYAYGHGLIVLPPGLAGPGTHIVAPGTTSSTTLPTVAHEPVASSSPQTASTPQCATQSCFAPYFSSCTPSEFTSTSAYWDVSYAIVGKNAHGCEVSMIYTKYPQPAAENKPMLCTLDTHATFSTAVQEALNGAAAKTNDCTGPLVTYLASH